MPCMYITEQGSSISASDGRIIVKSKDGLSERSVPEETLESLIIFGNVTMTTSAQRKCLEKGIPVTLLSPGGRYFGRLVATSFQNAERMKKQVYLSDDPEQCCAFARETLSAKIHNQYILLRRYVRNNHDVDSLSEHYKTLKVFEEKVKRGKDLHEIMGYEGLSARTYFDGLSKLINPEFAFHGRSKRPPKDAFNSMLSLGYTILFYEIYGCAEARSLNPYIGFVHQLKEHHPTLISDLLEEWRAPVVDAVVLSLVQGHEISIDEFSRDEKTGGVTLSQPAMKIFIRKLEQKMRSSNHYLPYLDSPVSFRRAIWWQTKMLASAIDQRKLEEYHSIRVR